jgi:hypothetical protein
MKSTTRIADSGCCVPALIGASVFSANNKTLRFVG